MSDLDLEEKFPNLTPIDSVPSLYTLNGIGTGLYGSRDYDEETGTYIKTLCFCVLFIPILSIKAYRVATADDGWYFIGREPLSTFARMMNFLVLAGVLSVAAGIGWQSYFGSDQYIASQQMVAARKLAENDKIAEAAHLYSLVAMGDTSHAAEAAVQINLLIEGPGQTAPATETAQVLKEAIALHKVNRWRSDPQLLVQQAGKLAGKVAKTDLRGALLLLDAVLPLAEDSKELQATRLGILERLVAKQPNDIALVSKLAVIYESQGKLEKCESILRPNLKKLGQSEGARVMGQLLAGKGEFELACDLLSPYCRQRLLNLHAAEKAFETEYTTASEAVFEDLKNDKAPDSFYQRYSQVGEAEQQAMVDQYIKDKLKNNLKIKLAKNAMVDATSVVPVALDLGIVQLRHAQKLANPEQRKSGFEDAEKTFLTIRSFAGETDEYHLFLGRVYYWLGKQKEGQKLLNDLLANKQRTTEVLLLVGSTLREVGEISQARQLAEEAYNKESRMKFKHSAASFRALLFTDLEDEILWLQLSDLSIWYTQASLKSAQGRQALQKNDDLTAARFFREAIQIYESQTESAATLNNSALVYFNLFHVTGDRQTLEAGMKKLKKAVSLVPDDSVLMLNAATSVQEITLRDIIGDSLDLKTLRASGEFDLLRFLYQDKAGRDKLIERVAKHPGTKQVSEYADRAMLLAPKNPRSYESAVAIASYLGNVSTLKSLLSRVDKADPEMDDRRTQTIDYYQGKGDEKILAPLKARVVLLRDIMKTAKAKSHDTTYAVAAVQLLESEGSLHKLGTEIDSQKTVELAEQASQLLPSRATRWALISALLFRAEQTLILTHTDYAKVAAATRRSISPEYRITFLLEQEGKLRDAILANADFQRVQAMLLKMESSTGLHTVWEWAILRYNHPDQANIIANELKMDELKHLEFSLSLRLAPYSAGLAYDAYWLELLSGKKTNEIAILKQTAERGVPMLPIAKIP